MAALATAATCSADASISAGEPASSADAACSTRTEQPSSATGAAVPAGAGERQSWFYGFPHPHVRVPGGPAPPTVAAVAGHQPATAAGAAGATTSGDVAGVLQGGSSAVPASATAPARTEQPGRPADTAWCAVAGGCAGGSRHPCSA